MHACRLRNTAVGRELRVFPIAIRQLKVFNVVSRFRALMVRFS